MDVEWMSSSRQASYFSVWRRCSLSLKPKDGKSAHSNVLFPTKQAIAKFFDFFLIIFRSFRGNSSKNNLFRSSSGRSGSSGKSRATRRQNSSLLRRLATTKTSKKRFGKKSIFWGFGNHFFVIFLGFWRESAFFSVKIIFLVKFCSRCTYSEVRATKNCEKAICAARTWPPRAT